ncbi:MAG: hypothetical protein C0622_14685 [Desulfuromonas sp.]|nr:MAG: hypothetical protein C0622_14685 [Desulfuromonas sp.]
MNQFSTKEMASGGLALVLESYASWGQFPTYAKHWAQKLNAQCLSGPVVTVDECVLEVKIQSGYFWISYDDFQSAIHLEPKEKTYNDIILALQKELQANT